VTSFGLNEDQVACIRVRNVGFRTNHGIDESEYDVFAIGV
jgi:hypothetical protein